MYTARGQGRAGDAHSSTRLGARAGKVRRLLVAVTCRRLRSPAAGGTLPPPTGAGRHNKWKMGLFPVSCPVPDLWRSQPLLKHSFPHSPRPILFTLVVNRKGVFVISTVSVFQEELSKKKIKNRRTPYTPSPPPPHPERPCLEDLVYKSISLRKPSFEKVSCSSQILKPAARNYWDFGALPEAAPKPYHGSLGSPPTAATGSKFYY